MKTAKSALFFDLPRQKAGGRAAGVGAAGKARGGEEKLRLSKNRKPGRRGGTTPAACPAYSICAAADYRMADAMSAQSASTFSSVVAQLVHRRIAL